MDFHGGESGRSTPQSLLDVKHSRLFSHRLECVQVQRIFSIYRIPPPFLLHLSWVHSLLAKALENVIYNIPLGGSCNIPQFEAIKPTGLFYWQCPETLHKFEPRSQEPCQLFRCMNTHIAPQKHPRNCPDS